ncbi:hypothetical protein [Streptomyces noursei]|uniref:hypothetical protein n=1 Tax=Streptomyces noursei TaxID=1971 RepID=UPI0035DBD747
MTAAVTSTPPDLPGRLADARAEAEKVRGELSSAENALAAALERGDFKAADGAKQRVEALRPHLALAEATEKALSDAMAALDAHRQAEHAAAVRQAREEAAQRAFGRAAAAEREAQESAERHYAEALAGVEAVRVSLQAAKQAERDGAEARRAAVVAQAEVAGAEPPQFTAAPAWASVRIDRSALLTAILRGRDL